jgi:TrmH family RNA methyltransferase
MITKNELKYYSSLLIKKYRQQEKKFLVEGFKFVDEGIQSDYECEVVLSTRAFHDEHKKFFSNIETNHRVEILSTLDFYKLSDTHNPQGVMAVFKEKEIKKEFVVNGDNIIAIDNISDPGNLGTILRNCDWFGVNYVLVSKGSVELYNPKVIRSSAGSIFHLDIFEEIDLAENLLSLKTKGYQIICSDLIGESVYNFEYSQKNVLVFSNEANGVSREILDVIDKKITIPKFGAAESLNVASASAIILFQLKKINELSR